MKRVSLATLAVLAFPLIALACSRRDDDLPPPIPVATAPAALPQQPRSPQPVSAPQGAAPPPGAGQPQGAAPPQGGAPGPAQPASTQIPASSPFQIPWFPLPSSLPTALPQIPGLPALPALPGLGVPPLPGAPPAAPPSTAPSPAAPAPTPASEPQGVAHVTVYGTKWCGACKSLQSDLTRRGVPYEAVDLEDPKAGNTPSGQRANEIPSNMRGSVPVTRVKQRSGKVVWVKGADGAGVESAYRA